MSGNKNILLTLFFLGWLASSIANAQDYKRKYKSARDFYDEGKYALAMEELKPVIVYDRDNPYVEYASFFYALSSYHQNFKSVAKDMLLQIKKLYPNWSHLDEVNYWLAKIYFEQGQFFQAMQMLREYPSISMQENVDIMKSRFLLEITDVETLRMMWEEYPEDRIVGKVLAMAISNQSFLERDVTLLDSLISKFGLDSNEFTSSLKRVNVFKEKYTVSLLFPFLANSLEPTTSTKINQSVLDLYLGMKMAVDTLKTLGINIELRSYDTERSLAATRELLELPELKNSDLLVGPLFQNQTKVVQDFSLNNRINMISPVSTNTEYIGENPFALLLQPRSETIGIRSAEWIANNIPNKICMVFFGESAKDTVMAHSFIEKAKELELTIVWAEKVSKELSGDIFKKLATPVEYDEFKNPIQFELKTDSIGSVFVASDDPVIYTKVISAVDTRGDSVIVVGNETWLNNAAANFETYERLHLILAAPTFTMYSNPKFIAFRKKFMSVHGVMPSEFSKIGFEFMWYIGHSLQKYGVYFQEGVQDEAFQSGFLFKGYDFSDARSNQFVPFIHFDGGEVVFLK